LWHKYLLAVEASSEHFPDLLPQHLLYYTCDQFGLSLCYQNHLKTFMQRSFRLQTVRANSNNRENIVGVSNGFSLDYNYLLNGFMV